MLPTQITSNAHVYQHIQYLVDYKETYKTIEVKGHEIIIKV